MNSPSLLGLSRQFYEPFVREIHTSRNCFAQKMTCVVNDKNVKGGGEQASFSTLITKDEVKESEDETQHILLGSAQILRLEITPLNKETIYDFLSKKEKRSSINLLSDKNTNACIDNDQHSSENDIIAAQDANMVGLPSRLPHLSINELRKKGSSEIDLDEISQLDGEFIVTQEFVKSICFPENQTEERKIKTSSNFSKGKKEVENNSYLSEELPSALPINLNLGKRDRDDTSKSDLSTMNNNSQNTISSSTTTSDGRSRLLTSA